MKKFYKISQLPTLAKTQTILSKPIVVFVVFLIAHLILLNINSAEWGDSYRILRASEFIRSGYYPDDEKRPPLFSIILAIRPDGVDPILFSRSVMLVISLINFLLFYKICILVFDRDLKKVSLALWLFAFNPVLLYWSIRIYADTFFLFFVLLSALVYLKKPFGESFLFIFSLSIITALSIFTRFEGFLLFGSLGLGLLFSRQVSTDKLSVTNRLFTGFGFISKLIPAASYGLLTAILLIPYFLWRNPFDSSYLSEPTARSFGFTEVATYVISLVFLFGFVYAGYFFGLSFKKILGFFRTRSFLGFYLIFNLLLVLIWPAAVPRLFVSGLPFLILILVIGIFDYFEDPSAKVSLSLGFTLLLFLIFYSYGQYKMRLQFLVADREWFVLLLFLNLIILIPLILRQRVKFEILIIVSNLLWSLAVINSHKNLLKMVVLGADFSSKQLSGIVAYNDVSSVSDWYLNNDPNRQNGVKGVFFPYYKKSDADLEKFKKINASYFLLTNEHNTSMTFDDQSKPYLRKIREFSENINGKEFFTKVYEVKYN